MAASAVGPGGPGPGPGLPRLAGTAAARGIWPGLFVKLVLICVKLVLIGVLPSWP